LAGTAVHGVLLVDKPAGPTSHDVVHRVRRALGTRDAGHTGTLDPAATGLLAICLGDALKLQRWLAEGDKTYLATVAFGASTTTEDAEGTVLQRGDPSGLTEAALRAALPALTGEIDQVPPMYSAVRVDGRRLHQAARAGEIVERAPRRVTVHALELTGLEPLGAEGLRLARLVVRCGKGTFVRTLAADLGRSLGVPAHLAALRRTATGPFRLEDALPLEALEQLAAGDRAALLARIVRPAEAVAFFPLAAVDANGAIALSRGRQLARPGVADGFCRVVGPDGALVAVGEVKDGRLRPVRVITAPLLGPGPGVTRPDPA
jgi:tRNA pseudouridine55 synthase